MSVSKALKTTFKGDGPTTQVIIPLVVAEADHGAPFETDEAFAQWIKDNNDRIYASAVAKRETSYLYETVTLSDGDMIIKLPADVPGMETVSTYDDEEARVIANGEAVEGVDPLFVGHFRGAVDYVLAMPQELRGKFDIWTNGRIYDASDFARIERERDERGGT